MHASKLDVTNLVVKWIKRKHSHSLDENMYFVITKCDTTETVALHKKMNINTISNETVI